MILFLCLLQFFSIGARASSGPSLDARQEGLYAIQLTCATNSTGCNTAIMRQTDRISIVNSNTDMGIWVTLASSQEHSVIDTFVGATVGPLPTEITASSSTMIDVPSRFAYMDMSIDPDTGAMTGTLIDVQTAATYDLVGTPIRRLANLSGKPIAASALSTFVGQYHGTAADNVGTFTLMQLPNQQFVASFNSDQETDEVPNLTLQFDTVTWNSTLNVLQMTLMDHRLFQEIEMDLVLDPSASNVLAGMYFTSAVVTPVNLTKIVTE